MRVRFSLPTYVSTRFKLALSAIAHTRGTPERKLYRSRKISAKLVLGGV
jgi:hypothetical protein